jgi:hypothetical protein
MPCWCHSFEQPLFSDAPEQQHLDALPLAVVTPLETPAVQCSAVQCSVWCAHRLVLRQHMLLLACPTHPPSSAGALWRSAQPICSHAHTCFHSSSAQRSCHSSEQRHLPAHSGGWGRHHLHIPAGAGRPHTPAQPPGHDCVQQVRLAAGGAKQLREARTQAAAGRAHQRSAAAATQGAV